MSKVFSKKLMFTKKTVVDLTGQEQDMVAGGDAATKDCKSAQPCQQSWRYSNCMWDVSVCVCPVPPTID
jgi:hypothetical protein